MVKFLKQGKVVLLLTGRYAGKKAFIIRTFDEGVGGRPYGHCVVVGINKAPLKITRSMTKTNDKMKKLLKKRCTIKPFVKVVNFTHLMPTRYMMDAAFVTKVAQAVPQEALKNEDVSNRKALVKQVKTLLEDRFQSAGNGKHWFFQKLRF